MEAGSYRHKVGGSKVIHSQSREIIANVYKFMKREAESGQPINVKQVQARVAEATGVSIRSLQRILNEEKECLRSGAELSTPHKKRPRKKLKTDLDDFDECVVRKAVNEFHLTQKERPTVKSLLRILKGKIDFNGSSWALRKILRRLGFRWRKSVNNRKLLIEKSEIREMRLKYLRTVEGYRIEGRPIIFMDETYVHSSHSKDKAWSDDSNSGLKTPISKGQRLIIVHAGSENGFVPNSLLMFKSGTKTGDYHDDMNYSNYEKWVRSRLLPNLPPNSVVVIDNAPYHNVQIDPAPTSSSRKADMTRWLTEHGIPFTDAMYKPELYSLIKMHKPYYKMYKIDAIFAEAGHSVLRLPPYHPDLNPIELIWGLMKHNIAKENITFTTDSVMKLVEETCASITKEDWLNRCEHCKKIEQEYLALEPAIDNLTEHFVINVNDDTGSDDDSDDETDIEETDDLSGVQPL